MDTERGLALGQISPAESTAPQASKSSPTCLGDRPYLFPILFYAILSCSISVKISRVSLSSQISLEITKQVPNSVEIMAIPLPQHPKMLNYRLALFLNCTCLDTGLAFPHNGKAGNLPVVQLCLSEGGRRGRETGVRHTAAQPEPPNRVAACLRAVGPSQHRSSNGRAWRPPRVLPPLEPRVL